VIALLVGVLIGWLLAPSDEGGNATPPAAEPTATQESSQSEQGAIQAATEYARIMASPGGESYVSAMESLAAPDWQDRARELANNTTDFVSERYGADGRVVFHPSRYRVTSFAPDSAVIDIWGVVLTTGSKIGGIEESWVTATVELLWVGSEWKVAGQSSRGGPTPELLRTDEGNNLQEVLEDFSGYENAAES
jgi:hypothetical protein